MSKFCRNCGSQMAQDEKFCAICGTKLKSNVKTIASYSKNQVDSEVKGRKVNDFRLVIGMSLILLAIFSSYFVIDQENRQNRENIVVEATVISCVMTYEEYDIVDGGYDREYRVGVKYTHNGENYESSIDCSSEKSIGKTIKIHINPNNPMETDGIYGGLTDYIATILFCAVPFSLAGVWLVISAFKNRNSTR